MPISELKKYFDDISILVVDHSNDLAELPGYKKINIDNW